MDSTYYYYLIDSIKGEDGRDEDARRAFQGLLNINLKRPQDVNYNNFLDKIRSASALPPFNYIIEKNVQVGDLFI